MSKDHFKDYKILKREEDKKEMKQQEESWRKLTRWEKFLMWLGHDKPYSKMTDREKMTKDRFPYD